MKKVNQSVFLVLLTLLVSLVLAACGDPTATSVTTPVATTAAPTTAATVNPTAAPTPATTVVATTASTTAVATTPAATTAAVSAAPTTVAPTVTITNGNYPPILFVHGNGDDAALWISTIWRFESNGWARDKLFAISYPNPNARDDDTVAQASRSSTEEQKQQLSAKVDEILAKTGANKLILIGNSRGGNSIRNYVKNGGGASKVSHVILGGATNHGVSPALPASSEFSSTGTFIKALNSGPGEVVDGVAFMTIRSDKNDKYAQPGAAGYDGPALKGANNVVLPGVDHRETAYSPQSFAEMWKFLTGKAPEMLEIKPETTPKLSGLITGFENKVPTNKGVAGVQVSVFEVDSKSGARVGEAVHQATTEADGSWGSFSARPEAYYEFVVKAPNMPVMHFFRTPFPRSSSYVTMRLFENPAASGKSVIYFTRPRGYVATGRDTHLLDGKPVPGVKSGVPTDASFRVEIEGPERAVPVVLNKESMTVRAIPDEVVYAEFHY